MLKTINIWFRSLSSNDYLCYLVKNIDYDKSVNAWFATCDFGMRISEKITYDLYDSAEFHDDWIMINSENDYDGILLFNINRYDWKAIMKELQNKLEEK